MKIRPLNFIKITTFYVTLMDTLQNFNAREITIYSLEPYENLKNSKKSLVELYGTILWGNKSQLTKRVPKQLLEMALEMLASKVYFILYLRKFKQVPPPA